jgi:hypothetical protein
MGASGVAMGRSGKGHWGQCLLRTHHRVMMAARTDVVCQGIYSIRFLFVISGMRPCACTILAL